MKIAMIILFLPVTTALAEEGDNRFSIELEAGIAGQANNNIQIPNDAAGTRFNLKDVIGSGPFAALRLSGKWRIGNRSELQLVLAPFQARETGQLEEPVRYNGAEFDPGDVKATYKFSTHRFTYRYIFRKSPRWKLSIGATALIRAADVVLEQGDTRTNYDNFGFVPLLNFKSVYRFSDKLHFVFDFNGLAGGPGRLLEGDVRIQFAVGEKSYLGFGYRILEGGVDIDDVYNFAFLQQGYLALGYRF